MLLKGKTIIWLKIYGSLTKSWKFEIFAGGFLFTIIFGTGIGQPGPDFSEMNNDADLIFIAVWQQMTDFSNVANWFDLDDGPYSYLDFNKWSLSNC